jgi:hypothetical protein
MSLSGKRFGRYDSRALGAGGMREGYRARDTRLDRTIAVKVIAARDSASTAAREGFERQARAIALLSHPSICTVHDVGHQDGTDFLVREYLEGEFRAQFLGRRQAEILPAPQSKVPPIGLRMGVGGRAGPPSGVTGHWRSTRRCARPFHRRTRSRPPIAQEWFTAI